MAKDKGGVTLTLIFSGASAESVGTLRPSPVLKTDEAGGLSVTK